LNSSGETTILVIEDDLGLLDLIREECLAAGWGFEHCRTGQEAIAWLGGHEPTLVLLDYSLPDMTGATLLDLVRMPPFIVTTGAGDERIAVEMMKRGALDYLVKDGLFLDTLSSVVERALSHVGTERRLIEAEVSLKLAQETLRQARKMESLGLMAGGIAHDFNNLFQSLQGNLEVAIRKVPGGTARPFLDKALAILAKASSLTHRMLDFTGKGFRNSDVLDPNALVRECLTDLEALPGAEIRFQAQESLPGIEGDKGQLLQVITGLVLNAREAQGPEAGPIIVASELCGPGEEGLDAGIWIQCAPAGEAVVCLTVEDHGSGMGEEVLERAFDPFFTTRKPGRGLGLSAALGILRGHDAGLWVSTAPGRGTTFKLFFQALSVAEAQAQAPQAPSPSTPVCRTVLLVDDDEDLQETLGEFLREGLGYPVLQARDGAEAVELFRRERDTIGVVLMDATMPRMGGAEAFKAILCCSPDAKGILCSGFSEESGNQTARECGFREFLKKPFPLKTLEEALHRAMGG
jgi:DNA-binding response OmpR family regulator